MRVTSSALVLFAALAALLVDPSTVVQAKKPSQSRAAVPPPSRRGGGSVHSRSAGRTPASRKPPSRRADYDEYDEEEDEYDVDEEDDDDDDGGLGSLPDDELDDDEEEEEDIAPPSRRRPSARGPPPGRGRPSPPSSASRQPPASRQRPGRPVRDDYDDDYDRPARSSSSRGRPSNSKRGGPPSSRRGSVVPYGRTGGRAGPSAVEGAASTFVRGWTAFKSSMPDPTSVREGVASSISAARETTSHLSSNIYRDIKGLTSSELEQVMLKSTRPDDTPVKGKHVERLVGVTYQISARYDIYDSVLRKLWSKMAEKDWRTTIKALYILHRFAADGAPEHAPALKARLRELRRTRDPKRKDKHFNSKQLLAGDFKPEDIKFRAFMSRYAHYVLLRAQCFGGVFDEISQKPSAPPKRDSKSKKSAAAAVPVNKPITSTNLRVEHLEAAAMLLKAGVACQLKDGEECENTAIAAERVASDLIGLTTAAAIALNRALKDDDMQQGVDPALIKRWCEFYRDELLPQTRAMVKKTSNKLDAYGLFLPSRMGASLSPELLQKGLKAEEPMPATTTAAATTTTTEEDSGSNKEDADEAKVDANDAEEDAVSEEEEEEEEPKEAAGEEEDDGEEYDEYEYEEEEYYDDEDA